MDSVKWSDSEKKLARRIFEAALAAELSETMAAFKTIAAAVDTPEAMWALEGYLVRKRREIDGKYDFRYSRLLMVFGRLLREGRIHEEQLAGLSNEKRSYIRRIQEI